MVVVAQLVRAPDCGSGGRRFETDLPPIKAFKNLEAFFISKSESNLLLLMIKKQIDDSRKALMAGFRHKVQRS